MKKLEQVLNLLGRRMISNEKILSQIDEVVTTISEDMSKKLLFVKESCALEILGYADCVVNIVLSAEAIKAVRFLSPENVWIVPEDKMEKAQRKVMDLLYKRKLKAEEKKAKQVSKRPKKRQKRFSQTKRGNLGKRE